MIFQYHVSTHLLNKDEYNNFYLEDCNSKFGTLVQAQKPIKLDENPASFQIGRTIFVASVPKPCSLCNWCNCFSGYKKKSKNGLVTLDGLTYFPKEYLEVEKCNNNTNSVGQLSDYLRNFVGDNQFERAEGEGEGDTNQLNNYIRRQDSEYGSESVSNSQRSYQDNMEEGKSLMEDFHRRMGEQRTLAIRGEIQSPSNYQGVVVNNEENEIRGIQMNMQMPPIPSEGSKVSNSSDSHNLHMINVNDELNHHNHANEEEKKSEASRSLDNNSVVKFQKSGTQNHEISELKLSSHNPSKRSSPRHGIIVKKNTMFEKDDKAEFLEAVFPFQEDFSQDNVFGDMKDHKKLRTSQEGIVLSILILIILLINTYVNIQGLTFITI